MPLEPDYLVDRRGLQRKVSFWRVAAILLFIIAIVVVGLRLSGGFTPLNLSPHIARLSIQGLITGDSGTLKLIEEIEKSNAKAVLISIESPGGTTTGSERLFEAIRKLANKKPTVAVVGTMAASGAYIAAIGTDRIVARKTSLVGSIGVLVRYPNIAKLLDTVGVKMETVKSSPLKAEPSGYEPTSPEVRAALTAIINDSYDWFKGLVKDRRQMNDDELAAVDDGRVFTGRQAIDLKLIDEVGGEREAVAWLEHEKGIQKGLPIRDWKANPSLERLGFLGLSARLAAAVGFDDLAQALEQGRMLSDARLLDGLVSIWQVGGAN